MRPLENVNECESKKARASDNNMFTYQRTSRLGPGSKVEEAVAGTHLHCLSQPRSRPAELVLIARLVHLRVNGRREHGNVIRKIVGILLSG